MSSLKDILNLSQDQICQKVFTFRKETNGMLSGDNYTEIQDALNGAPNLVNISKENLSSFMFFQIKKV